jgi:hypothetical protein
MHFDEPYCHRVYWLMPVLSIDAPMPRSLTDEHFNGEDPPVPPAWRSFFQRIDNRSMETIAAVGRLAGEVSGLTSAIKSVREYVQMRLDEQKRDAALSGEHLAQELRNVRALLEQRSAEVGELREEVRRKEEEATLAQIAKLDAENAHLRKRQSDAAADMAKRKRDLAWRILEWAILLAGGGVLAHLAWH